MPERINSEGLLEFLHPETGAYVPASVLLQVEGGILASLVPEQIALISDIKKASTYLQGIDAQLQNVRSEIVTCSNKLNQTNSSLNLLGQVDSALNAVKAAVDGLEALGDATNVLLAATRTEIAQLSGKLPTTLGAKIRDNSVSVAIATDSTIFNSLASIISALSDGSSNSVAVLLAALSAKIPASLGSKLNAGSLSVALATDSTIFNSLASIVSALSDSNTSIAALVAALSAKLPASLGAKVRDSSLSVALATDSTIFASLTSILNALSDGGSNSALSYLSTVAGAQFWKAPTKFNSSSPIINAATTATSSTTYTISSQATGLSLQNFYSITGSSAQFEIELRLSAGATSLSDKIYYYRGDVASPFLASAGAYPGETPIVVPTQGCVQAVVHLSTITGGNVSTYAKEIR